MAKQVILYPLGVGDSATKRHWWTHFMLDVDGRRLFVDCPGKFQAMLAQNAKDGELSVTLSDYREVILTHTHFDHVDGCRELAENPPEWITSDGRIKLYAPQFVLDELWTENDPPKYATSAAHIKGGAAALDRVFERVPLNNPHDFGSFKVAWKKGRHTPQAVGYLFDFGGFSFAYSADTGTLPEFQDWLAQADVIVHEVHLGEIQHYIPDLHTPLADLLKLPESFQRKTYLCHYADDFEQHLDIGHYRYLRQNKVYRLQ
jgi:ribonuclease BN (tRNA processing enzyme)